MKDYYEILGIDELTSKPLTKIAYVTAIDYCLLNNLGSEKVKDVNEAYLILKRYRLRIRYSNMKRNGKTDQKIKEIINYIASHPDSGKSKLTKTSSQLSLEIKFIIKSLLFEICTFVLSIISTVLGDILTVTSNGISLIASLIFYFGLINLWTNWVPQIFSIVSIITSIVILKWFLNSMKKQVIKAISK